MTATPISIYEISRVHKAEWSPAHNLMSPRPASKIVSLWSLSLQPEVVGMAGREICANWSQTVIGRRAEETGWKGGGGDFSVVVDMFCVLLWAVVTLVYGIVTAGAAPLRAMHGILRKFYLN